MNHGVESDEVGGRHIPQVDVKIWYVICGREEVAFGEEVRVKSDHVVSESAQNGRHLDTEVTQVSSDEDSHGS
jgi:hypothetical protein